MRFRLIVALAGAILAVIFVTAVFAFDASRDAEVQELAKLHGEDLLEHMALSVAVQRFVEGAGDVLVRGESEQWAEQAIRDAESRFEAIADTRARMAELDEDADDFDEERETTAKMRQDFDRIVAEYRAGAARRRDGARMSEAEFNAAFQTAFRQAFLGRIRATADEERQDAANAWRESERISRQAFGISLAAAAGAVLFLVLLFRSIARGITELIAGADRIAAGELSHRISTQPTNELGSIASAFNGMAERLQDAQAARVRAEKLAAVGQLSASIGHELRNPLGAVRNAHHYVTKRLKGTELGEDARMTQFLGIIDKELTVCGRIISDLLDFARERPLARSVCPLKPLVDDAISVVRPGRAVRIDNEVSADLPTPSLDQDQIRQVLVNLIQNAAEAVPEDRDGQVRITAEAAGGTIVLRVIDNGAGISKEDQRVILEPLFTTKSKGTGLGLAIVDGIIKRHEGTLDVDSKVGAGTTFTIRIPLGAEAPDPGMPAEVTSGRTE
jgi:signal transduction histidine kinase